MDEEEEEAGMNNRKEGGWGRRGEKPVEDDEGGDEGGDEGCRRIQKSPINLSSMHPSRSNPDPCIHRLFAADN